MHHWISFYLIPVNVRWWQTSLHAFRVSRGPDLLILPVQHQFAIIGQVKTAYVTAGFGGVCVPPGLVIIVVHDQVAVSLHAQAGSVWSCSVWSPQRLPAVDNKVTVVLQGTKTHLIDSETPLPKLLFSYFCIYISVYSPGKQPYTPYCWRAGSLPCGAHHACTRSSCSWFCNKKKTCAVSL